MNLDVLDRYGPFLRHRLPSVSLALESVASRPAPVIVELGTSRSFVDGGQEGVMSADPRYWDPDRPERWDWGAGIFTRVCGEAIVGTDATLHSVDPLADAISIATTIVDGLDAEIELHQTTSTEFLDGFAQPIDLLYMDHHETSEEGARVHLVDAHLVLEQGLLADGGVIVVDDVRTYGHRREALVDRWRSLWGNGHLHHGKGKYSIPLLVDAGFEIGYDGYQVVLHRSSSS